MEVSTSTKLWKLLIVLLIAQVAQTQQDFAKRNAGSCMLDGQFYDNGQQFITKDCSLSCICTNSKLTCQTACPIVAGDCPEQHKVEYINMQQDVKSRCRCPRMRRCIAAGPNAKNRYSLSYMSSLSEDKESAARTGSNPCFVNGKEYQPGQKYITEDCKAICTCRVDFASCHPLCEREKLICPDGFRASVMRQQVSMESHCFCDIPTCLEEYA